MQEETQKFVRYCSFCKTDIVTVRYGAGCRARHVPITSNQKSAVCFDKKEIQKRSSSCPGPAAPLKVSLSTLKSRAESSAQSQTQSTVDVQY